MLAYFDRPGTSNGPTEAINGRLEHLRGSALGFRNLTNYIARSLLETGGFRPTTTPSIREEPLNSIDQYVSGGVLVCSGDKHGSADIRYTSSTGKLIATEMLAGPADNSVKHSLPNPTDTMISIVWRGNNNSPPEYRGRSDVVGLVDVNTSSSPMAFTMNYVRCEDGVVLYSRRVEFS